MRRVKGSAPKVFVVGPYPPPVHGMAKNTAIAAEDLSRVLPVSRIDTSPGSLFRGPAYHVRKAVKVLVGGLRMLVSRGAAAVYMPSDAGWGIVYSIFFVLISRLRFFPVFIHHRSFKYIDEQSGLMALLVKVAGARAVHVFLCGCMKDKFASRYPQMALSEIVSNAKYVSPQFPSTIRSTGGKLVLGHLSNLGFEKGLAEVVAVAKGLLGKGHSVELRLAGPATSPETLKFVETAQRELGDALVWVGPVYGDAKAAFYRKIDYFLFPTRYENEAQPNVVFEAMSFGAPAVVTRRGCLEGDIGRGGKLVEDSENYVSEAIAYLEEGLSSSGLCTKRKYSALLEVSEQSASSQAGYQGLLERIVGAATNR